MHYAGGRREDTITPAITTVNLTGRVRLDLTPCAFGKGLHAKE
jgi:hypothetical protein